MIKTFIALGLELNFKRSKVLLFTFCLNVFYIRLKRNRNNLNTILKWSCDTFPLSERCGDRIGCLRTKILYWLNFISH